MTPDLLSNLARYPGFPATARLLMEIAGVEAAAALIAAWPGQEWPVPVVVGGGSMKGRRRYAALVEIVGDEAARKITRYYGGTRLYVPICDFSGSALGRNLIRAEYEHLVSRKTGYRHDDAIFELGLKYRKTGRSIERIVNRLEEPDVSPQHGLF